MNKELFVLAKKKCKVLFYPYDTAENCTDPSCFFHLEILRNLPDLILHNIAEQNFRMILLTYKGVRDKLLTYFNYLSLENSSKTIELPFSLTDLADYLMIDRTAMMREIKRLKKMQSRGTSSKYFFVLLALIAIVNILDEVTSNLTVTVQSSFVTEFFVNNPFMGKYYTYEDGLAFHSGIGVFTYVLGLFTPFYKALADKWGRKKFLIINTFGMSFAMLVIFLSNNIVLYFIGACMVQFFIPHDMHVVYIMESAPSKKRAVFYSVIKVVANMGSFCRRAAVTCGKDLCSCLLCINYHLGYLGKCCKICL